LSFTVECSMRLVSEVRSNKMSFNWVDNSAIPA
jgi:hypothetical protein